LEVLNHKTTLWSERSGEGAEAIGSKVDFPALDQQIFKLWKKEDVFKRTISEREGCPEYIEYDGPPGTNGAPHIGHLMQSALKDLWPRYYTMKGYRVLRKAGWDTHGLPVELTAEKELGLHSKRDIIEYGVEKYIDYCRKTVFRYREVWTKAILRCGRFLDTDNPYMTLTNDYIQTDWWVLKNAWDKGLLYQGSRIMPHCPRCGTSLSSHETAQGYKDISDISLYVKFPVEGKDKTYFIAWTTTAWTLLSNVALAVNPELMYITIEVGEERYILAEERLEALKDQLGNYNILERKPGKELCDLHYRPLWDFLESIGKGTHRVLVDDYVTAEDGSGIVHLALYGEDDFRIIQKNNLPVVQNVNLEGLINDIVTPFAGRWFREEGLDVDILKNLAEHGLLLGKEKITHSYPHCYRCDTPLMYYSKSGWFLRTSAFKNQMLKANEDINWYPEHIKYGRFGKWLENNVDWAISRERYWGSPLPIWTCTECNEQVCVGSLKELSELREEPLPGNFDPHKPAIDKVELTCSKCGSVMKHEPEVLDPWFNAGIMPWGQWGYPAVSGSKVIFHNQYPGDFICEAIDQTRGWFYTMLAVSTLLTDRSSFRNVICTEHILDDYGHKMSKSRGNIVDPVEQCEKFGADAVRWNFFAVHPWTVRRYKEDDVREALKQILIPYWNAYSFFVTYARVDGWKPEQDTEPSERSLDRWILSRLEWMREEVEEALKVYDVARASGAIATYIDELTNWYIRRSRRRFWKTEDDTDKRDAYQTLYNVLVTFNRILAPFIPFVTEAVYQNLERGYKADSIDSVHLCSYPEANMDVRDIILEETMERTRKIVSLGRALRNEGSIRVRQPLLEVIVAGTNNEVSQEYIDLITDELNVKNLRFISDPKELYRHRAKANFKLLGPRFSGEMNRVAQAIAQLNDETLSQLINDGSIEVDGEIFKKEEVELSTEALVGYWVRDGGGLTVAVNHHVDDELHAEWLAREFVHHVQNLRRDADLNVTERIRISFLGDDQLNEAVEKYQKYICIETLATDLMCDSTISQEQVFKIGDQTGIIIISVNSKKVK